MRGGSANRASYCTRQVWAKSHQVLSVAAPAIFIFCHCNPQACIRSRDAGGRLGGGAITPGDGAGVANGGAGGAAGKAGAAKVERGLAKSEGRAGGRGAAIRDFDLPFDSPDASCARAALAVAARVSATARRSAACRRRRGVWLLKAKTPLLPDGACFLLRIFSTKSKAPHGKQGRLLGVGQIMILRASRAFRLATNPSAAIRMTGL